MNYKIVFIFLCILCVNLRAEVVVDGKIIATDSVVKKKSIFNLRKDKNINNDSLKIESIIKKNEEKPHSPHKATIMALLLPGLGQIYNDQWWKVPILYGGIGADIYGITWNAKNYVLYRDSYIQWVAYREALAKDPETPYPENPAWDDIQKSFDVETDPFMQTEQGRDWFEKVLSNKRTSYKRNRDLCYIIMGAIYALNVIDATVFAHFYDFEIDDDLSLNLQPQSTYSPLSGPSVGLSLTLNF